MFMLTVNLIRAKCKRSPHGVLAPTHSVGIWLAEQRHRLSLAPWLRHRRGEGAVTYHSDQSDLLLWGEDARLTGTEKVERREARLKNSLRYVIQTHCALKRVSFTNAGEWKTRFNTELGALSWTGPTEQVDWKVNCTFHLFSSSDIKMWFYLLFFFYFKIVSKSVNFHRFWVLNQYSLLSGVMLVGWRSDHWTLDWSGGSKFNLPT